jgi:hypothetical protein
VLDPARAIRKTAALRTLCLSLPHVPTPAEIARLRLFDELAAQPESATGGDIEALATGWRHWWRQGDTGRLRAMAARVPAALVAADRRLATYACAAGVRVDAETTR